MPSFNAGIKQSKATSHKNRLTAWHHICLLFFRHLAQKSLDNRQVDCGISIQSDEKIDCASAAPSLCGIALIIYSYTWRKSFSKLSGALRECLHRRRYSTNRQRRRSAANKFCLYDLKGTRKSIFKNYQQRNGYFDEQCNKKSFQ